MNTSSVRKLCRVVAAATCCAVLFGCSPEPTRKSSGPSTSADTTTSPGAPASNDSGGGASPGGGKSSPVGMSRTGAPQRASERTPKRPNATPPARPAAMSQVSPQGAVAAAEHYLNLTAYVGAKGDFAELDRMSGPDCKFCREFIEAAKTANGKGQWTSVPKVTILKHQEGGVEGSAGKYWVNLVAHKEKYSLVKSDGGKYEKKAEDLLFVFELEYDKGWRVVQLNAGNPDKWEEVG